MPTMTTKVLSVCTVLFSLFFFFGGGGFFTFCFKIESMHIISTLIFFTNISHESLCTHLGSGVNKIMHCCEECHLAAFVCAD